MSIGQSKLKLLSRNQKLTPAADYSITITWFFIFIENLVKNLSTHDEKPNSGNMNAQILNKKGDSYIKLTSSLNKIPEMTTASKLDKTTSTFIQSHLALLF